MIIISEKMYCQTPTLIQIICLLYYIEGYKEKYGLILEVLTSEDINNFIFGFIFINFRKQN